MAGEIVWTYGPPLEILSRFCLCWVGVGDTGREFVWCGMGLELMQDSYTIVLMLLLMLCCYLEERGGKERL
jgi:hypothetical protein